MPDFKWVTNRQGFGGIGLCLPLAGHIPDLGWDNLFQGFYLYEVNVNCTYIILIDKEFLLLIISIQIQRMYP